MSRKQRADDEAYTKLLGKDVLPTEPLPADGRHVRTRMMSPNEVAEVKQRRRARRSE